MIDLDSFNLDTLPSLLLEQKNRLPRSIGVYLVVTGDKILYIGRSQDLLGRWKTHHRLKELHQYEDVRIHWLELSSNAISAEIEQVLINHFQPELNGKGNGFTTRMTTDVPPEIHQRLKFALAKMKTNSNKLVNALIVNFLDENDF